MAHIVRNRLLRGGKPGDPVAELFEYVEAEGLPLVDV
jgi:hypothetical protein